MASEIRREAKTHTGVTPLDITQLSKRVDALSQALSLRERAHLSGRFIDKHLGTGIAIALDASAGINLIPHGLGRKYQGWYVVGQDASSIVWNATDAEIAANNVDTKVHLPLECSANVSIKLVVF